MSESANLVERLATVDPDVEVYYFHCPGCVSAHQVVVRAPEGWGRLDGKGGARWTFNGDRKAPTFEPSILVHAHEGGGKRCHSFVRNGRIEFLADCQHELAGKTVELGPI